MDKLTLAAVFTFSHYFTLIILLFKRPEIIKMSSDRAKQVNKTNNPMWNIESAKKHNDQLRDRPNFKLRSTYLITYEEDGKTETIQGLKNVLKYFGLKDSCNSSIIRAVQKTVFSNKAQ